MEPFSHILFPAVRYNDTKYKNVTVTRTFNFFSRRHSQFVWFSARKKIGRSNGGRARPSGPSCRFISHTERGETVTSKQRLCASLVSVDNGAVEIFTARQSATWRAEFRTGAVLPSSGRRCNRLLRYSKERQQVKVTLIRWDTSWLFFAVVDSLVASLHRAAGRVTGFPRVDSLST